MRLIIDPIAKVTLAPIMKYHVKATLVNWKTHRIVASPANMPMRAPRAFALRSRVPNRKSPSKLPEGNEITVKPASRSGPHFIRPKAIKTNPQVRVMRRDNFKKLLESSDFPHSREKSRTLEAAREFSEPLALDMATAMMEASSRPASPGGISRARNSGRTR